MAAGQQPSSPSEALEQATERIRELVGQSSLNFKDISLDPNIELPEISFDGATHFCQSLVKTFSSFDAGSLPIGNLAIGEQLKAIELDLGDNFDFGLFENSAGDRFFLKESDLASFGTLFRIKPLKKLNRVIFDRFPDFKSADFNLPFFKDDAYSVKFDTGMKSKEEIMNRLEDFKILGIKEIVDYYGKMVTDVDILSLKDAFGFINLEEILTPTRKGASHEVIMSIKAKYLDALPDKNIAFFQDFYQNVLSTNFKPREFSNIISNLSKILKKNHASIAKFNGLVEGIDLAKLSDKNFDFFNNVKSLLKENGYVLENLSTDAKMEFGFDPTTLDLAYIMMFDGLNPGKFLNIGMNKLSLMTDPKISKLMLSAKDMLSTQNATMGWQQFLSSYFGGDYSILFGKIKENLGLNIPISDLEDTFNDYKDRYGDPFKDARDALDLSNLIESDQFKDVTSQILSKARNQIGDNFLLNLSEIIANIDDLESLYQLVFDKISVEDLSSLLLEKAAEELGVKDINEIIARAVMKKMAYEEMINMIFDDFTDPEFLKAFLADICFNYEFGFEEIETVLETFETNLYSHILHYDDQGNLQGMLTENLPTEASDFVKDKLDELGYTDCASLFLNLKYRDVFEVNSAREIICRIFQGEIPTFSNPCSELAQDIKDLLATEISFQSIKLDIRASLKKMNPIRMRSSIDFSFKRMFREDNNFFQKLMQIPKFRFAFDKESKTRNKLFKRNSGVGIDLELSRKEKGFSLPSLKSVNPKFDFASFQIGGIDDIFGGALGDIESSIKSGIETSLVSSFKMLLQNLLQSLKGGMDLSVPDFGGERIGDLFDASNGMGLDLALDGLLPKFEGKLNSLKSELDRRNQSGFSIPDFENYGFLPVRRLSGSGFDTDLQNLGIKIGVLDPMSLGDLNGLDLPSLGNLNLDPLGMPSLDDLAISKQDIMDFLDQISDGLKPKEVFEFMRGNMDDFEFSKISTLVKDPKMKLILDDELIKSVSETCSELVDLDLIDEIEEIYDSREPVGVLCENLGLNYGLSPYPDVKTLAEELAENYDGMSEQDIADIMQDLLDNIKDNVSDAMGKAGNVDLPFSSDPDTFMPPPSDIPAMDYANDVVLDAIFDPISKEYKREAATYSDNLLIPRGSNEYVKMYYEYGDGIVVGYSDENGLEIEAVTEDYRYNTEFESYYKNRDTQLYYKDGTAYREYEEDSRPDIKLVTEDADAEFNENNYYLNISDKTNVYVKKDTTELFPPLLETFLGTLSLKFEIDSEDNLAVSKRFGAAGGQVSLEYSGSQRTLSILEAECDETLLATTQIPKNPVVAFKDNLSNYITTIHRGAQFSSSISGILNEIFVSLNEHVFDKIISSYLRDNRMSELQNIYTMVIDSERIDLLDIESIKNIAKEDYNNNFSFKSGEENQMSKSAMSGLVYANYKLYVIELLVRGYFTLDTFYNIQDMPSQFPDRVKVSFRRDFANYPEYLDKFESISSNHDMIIEKVYFEVVEELSLVFEDAKTNVYELMSIINQDFVNIMEAPQNIPVRAMRSFLDNVRFIITPFYLDSDGTELTERTEFTLDEDGNSTQPARFRLSYLAQLEDVEVDDRFEADSPSRSMLEPIRDYYGVESGNDIGHRTILTTLGSTSQTVLFPLEPDGIPDNGVVPKEQTLSIIPLLESDKQTYKALINQFVSKYTIFTDLNDLIVAMVSNEVARQAPQVLTAFASTKEAIKTTFESLKNSEKTFDNDDKQLEFSVSRYPEGAGTDPEYSNVARKMALQTVPLILKGMAEKFDTNTQIASGIRLGADLAGVYIPPQVASLIVFGASNFTIPPNPLGLMYLASGYLEPKERKRIKEMIRGRNTKQDVAVDNADDILEQLENVSEIAKQQSFGRSFDIINSVISLFETEYLSLREIYLSGGYFERGGANGQTDRYLEYPLQRSSAEDELLLNGLYYSVNGSLGEKTLSSSKLKAMVENFYNIVRDFGNHAAILLKETGVSGGGLDDDAIEDELIPGDNYEKLKAYLQNSLKATYWISEGLNMIVIMCYNLDIRIQELPYSQEMLSSEQVENDYNPRFENNTANQIFNRYKSDNNRNKEKYNYQDVTVNARLFREKLAKWCTNNLWFTAVKEEYGTGGLQYSYVEFEKMIEFINSTIIPYLEDNGY